MPSASLEHWFCAASGTAAASNDDLRDIMRALVSWFLSGQRIDQQEVECPVCEREQYPPLMPRPLHGANRSYPVLGHDADKSAASEIRIWRVNGPPCPWISVATLITLTARYRGTNPRIHDGNSRFGETSSPAQFYDAKTL